MRDVQVNATSVWRSGGLWSQLIRSVDCDPIFSLNSTLLVVGLGRRTCERRTSDKLRPTPRGALTDLMVKKYAPPRLLLVLVLFRVPSCCYVITL